MPLESIPFVQVRIARKGLRSAKRKVMGTTAMSSERFTLTAKSLSSTHVQLNGKQLDLGADDVLPPLHGVEVPSGTTMFAPASITFLAIPGANNAACR